MEENVLKTITVIIPIYNAEGYLKNLFVALETNQFVEGDEILLIDNGSTDRSVDYCKEAVKKHPNLIKILHYTEKAGSYATRNYGVSLAKGDILVFTDSDTIPVSNWIKSIRENAEKGTILAGRIILDIINNNLWEHFDNIAHLNSEKNAKDSCIATANMAVLRTDFFEVGLFEERFSGGDYEWSIRAVKNNFKIKFLKEAVVHHPTRKTFEQILKKEQRIAFGDGNHNKLNNRSALTLKMRYFLKFFKIDTNIRYSMQLRKLGFSSSEILKFNKKFMIIRFEQYKYAVKGYEMQDVRALGVR